ncbi:CDP-paratose 2-epimerase [Candidatus Marinamargulisbacteria bacterium SCGC AG-439-L15]|nr:CDP-paratose 2-epimerase [Candidatus Marinamargulisbacteria bacterium SCGC AG-439-L15]
MSYILNQEQFVPYPIDEVFSFFSKAENLEKITPPKLKFRILTPTPVPMHPGVVIDYKIRIFPFTMRWTSIISEYTPPHHFTDVQLKGPYDLWHHTHGFKSVDGGTLMTDSVTYRMPFGLLGRLVHFLWVKRDIESIFKHRQKVLSTFFPNKGS